MRPVSDFEIIIKRLITDDVKEQIETLRKSYWPAFIEGGLGKKGGLRTNLGARFIVKNDIVGIFVLRKLIELSNGLFEAYARIFISDSDLPNIGYCDGNGHHKTIYTTKGICPICHRKPKKCSELTEECQEQLKEFRVSIDEL
jgi:hypothetical protein